MTKTNSNFICLRFSCYFVERQPNWFRLSSLEWREIVHFHLLLFHFYDDRRTFPVQFTIYLVTTVPTTQFYILLLGFTRFLTRSFLIFFLWGEWRLINVECNCHLHSTATRNALKAHYSLTIIVPYVIITTFMIRQINFSTKNKEKSIKEKLETKTSLIFYWIMNNSKLYNILLKISKKHKSK